MASPNTRKSSLFSESWWRSLWERIASFEFFPSTPRKRARSEEGINLMPTATIKFILGESTHNQSFDTVSTWSEVGDSMQRSRQRSYSDPIDCYNSAGAIRIRIISEEGNGMLTLEESKKREEYLQYINSSKTLNHGLPRPLLAGIIGQSRESSIAEDNEPTEQIFYQTKTGTLIM